MWSLHKHENLTTGEKYCGKEEKFSRLFHNIFNISLTSSPIVYIFGVIHSNSIWVTYELPLPTLHPPSPPPTPLTKGTFRRIMFSSSFHTFCLCTMHISLFYILNFETRYSKVTCLLPWQQPYCGYTHIHKNFHHGIKAP